MQNVFVRPRTVDGKPVIVRDPLTRLPLAATGEWKPQTQFWTRRLRDKDVERCDPPAPPSSHPPAPVAAQTSTEPSRKSRA